MIIELIGGYWANSVAVISDALHLSVDLVGYAIQITSAYLAMKKSTKTYNFGMARSEPFGALLNCFTIWGLTIYLLFEAVSRILTPPKYFEPGIMLFTATFGVLANMAMAAIINGPGILITMVKFPFMSKEEKDNLMVEHEGENLNIRTVMAHINGDLAYSVGVLLAAIGININNEWLILDPLLTILFSYVVLHITLPIFRDSTKAIMEANPDEDKYDILSREIYSVKDVNKLITLRIWSLTQDQICAAIHINVAEGANEQTIQFDIGKALQKNDISFWTIQCYKPGTDFRAKCPFDDDNFA